jgi:hypothetical protein
MNTLFMNDEPAVPAMTRIDVQFVEAAPIQLEIKSHMNTKTREKSLKPSLFQIAASVDDFAVAQADKPAPALPAPDDWVFSRERLERALTAKVAQIEKKGATGIVNNATEQPLSPTTGQAKRIRMLRPVGGSLFDVANALVEAA